MYVPTFWLCLWTDFRAKYTYGLFMTQGVSEKYKIADYQEKKTFCVMDRKFLRKKVSYWNLHRFQLMVPVPDQKPPNFLVVIEW